MKKQTLYMVIFFLLIHSLCLAGWVDPINVPKIWPAYDFQTLYGGTHLAIASSDAIGTVVLWVESDEPDAKIYGTLWNGSKTLIDTIQPDDMNPDICPEGTCGDIGIVDIEITSQAVYDGVRDCFYVAVLAYEMCPVCTCSECMSGVGRTESWVEVYKVWNNSGSLASVSLGQFGFDTTESALIREVERDVPLAASGSTKIHNVAIEKSEVSGTTYVNLYYIYSFYEDVDDPYYYIYRKNVYSSVGDSKGTITSWDEASGTGMGGSYHCIDATFDDYSEKIWIIYTRRYGNSFYASLGKMKAVGGALDDLWDLSIADVIDCRICADNNSTAGTKIGICWQDADDDILKAAIATDGSGPGSSFDIVDDTNSKRPDITYIDSGYFAVVFEKWSITNQSSICMTRFSNGAPSEKEMDIYVAKDGIITGMNPTKKNMIPRIATYPGTNSGQIYLVWRGEDSSSNKKIVGKRTSSAPFRSCTYYSTMGKMIIPADPDWEDWRSDLVDANSYYGANYRQCVIDVTTTGFGVGNQVYDSYFKVYLYENQLDDKHADLRLLDDPTDPESGTSLPDLADSTDGTGWTQLIDVSVALNYWKKRPAGHDCFHVKLAPAYGPWDERIRIYLNYTNKKPSLYLYYIDWEP